MTFRRQTTTESRQSKGLKRRILVVAAWASLLGAAGASVAQPQTFCETRAQRVVCQTNAVRANAGIAPLHPDAKLNQRALAKAKRGVPAAEAATLRGDNLAWGYASVKEAEAAWLASPGHRANILDPTYHHTGSAVVGTIYVQEFER